MPVTGADCSLQLRRTVKFGSVDPVQTDLAQVDGVARHASSLPYFNAGVLAVQRLR